MPEIKVFCDVPGHRLVVTQRPDGGLAIGLEAEPDPAPATLAAQIEHAMYQAIKTRPAVIADLLSAHYPSNAMSRSTTALSDRGTSGREAAPLRSSPSLSMSMASRSLQASITAAMISVMKISRSPKTAVRAVRSVLSMCIARLSGVEKPNPDSRSGRPSSDSHAPGDSNA